MNGVVMNKSILFVVPHLGRSGPTKQLSYLVAELQSRGFDITIFGLMPEKPHNLHHLFDAQKITLNLANRRNALFRVFHLISLVIFRQFHVVHTQGLVPDVICALIMPKRKWVAVARNFPPEDYVQKFRGARGQMMAKLHLFAHHRCHNLVTCSKSLGQSYATLGLATHPIMNAIHDFPIAKTASAKKRFVFVGNIIPRKNVRLMCHLFSHFNLKDSVLDVVGGGADLEDLKLEFRLNTQIQFHGPQSNVMPYLQDADIFLNFSNSEGLPNSVLEALMAGCFCVLSTIEPHEEIRSEIGHGVLTFHMPEIYDEKIVADLAAEISSQLSRLPQSKMNINRQQVLRKFGTKRLGEEFIEFYEMVRSKT